MRKLTGLLLVLGLCAPGLAAQGAIGKRVPVQAGSPEDKALTAISNETDAAKKVALAEKYAEEFGKDGGAIPAYELLMADFGAQKDYDRAFEYGDKILKIDPDNFAAASFLTRMAQEKGDTAQMFARGEQVGQILQRFDAAPPPSGTDAETWQAQKRVTLNELNDQIRYIEYNLFNAAYTTGDAAQRAALLERFVAAFPRSQYANPAQQLVAASYQQAQNFPKMLEFANGVLARDPNNIGMLLLLADHLSSSGQQLDKAEANAKKALELLGTAQKPEQVSDADWARQKSLQQGLAQSALGQVYVTQKKYPAAIEAFKAAGPLLKSDSNTYGRNLYRLGFTYALMKNNTEARKALTEAISVDSPYKSLAQETLSKLGPAPPPKKRG